MDLLGFKFVLFEVLLRFNQRLSDYKELRTLLASHVSLTDSTVLPHEVDYYASFQTIYYRILSRKCRMESKYNDLNDIMESLKQNSKLYLFCRCKSNLSKLKIKLSEFKDSEQHLEILYAISSLGYENSRKLASNQINSLNIIKTILRCDSFIKLLVELGENN